MDGGPIGGMGDELAGLGARLRKLHGERGWRLEDLAERTGLSRAYLSRLEGGERQPSLGALFGVARVYDVPFSSLFEPEPEAEDVVVVRASGARPGAATACSTLRSYLQAPPPYSPYVLNLELLEADFGIGQPALRSALMGVPPEPKKAAISVCEWATQQEEPDRALLAWARTNGRRSLGFDPERG